MGKLSGILFLFFTHLVFANVTISKDANLVEKQVDAVSDQTENIYSDGNIYVTSGTSIIDPDHSFEEKIIIIEPRIPNISKNTAKKVIPKKANAPVETKKYVNKELEKPVTYFYPSSQRDFFYSSNDTHTSAVISSQFSYSKVFIRTFTIVDYQFILELSHAKNNSFFTQIFTSEYQNSFSGRAPPVFT